MQSNLDDLLSYFFKNCFLLSLSAFTSMQLYICDKTHKDLSNGGYHDSLIELYLYLGKTYLECGWFLFSLYSTQKINCTF